MINQEVRRVPGYADLYTTTKLPAAELLRDRLSLPDAWLVAIVSERAKDLDRLLWVLDLAREKMQQRHYAVLPVRHESMDWNLPAAFTAYPRIETRGDDLVIVWPDTPYRLPLRRWLRMRVDYSG